MASRVFLHVGTMKSATTYIQSLCDENAELLATLGVLWQGSGANFGAVTDFYATAHEPQREPAKWNGFIERLHAFDGTALVSNELLAARRRRRIADLVDGFGAIPITVIVTARDLARALPSQWQTRAIRRPTESWVEFMDHLIDDGSRSDPRTSWFWHRQDLSAIVERYAAVIGMDNVVVVTVPPSGSDPDLLVERFFSVLGLTDVPALRQSAVSNPSMGAHSVELIRRINGRLTDDERVRLRLALKHVLARRVLAGRRHVEPPIQLTPSQSSWASSIAEDMISGLIDAGVAVVGDLADLRPRQAATSVSPVGERVSDAAILGAAVDAMIGLVDALDELARTPRGETPNEALRLLARSGGTVDEAED